VVARSTAPLDTRVTRVTVGPSAAIRPDAGVCGAG
jgi:hypothetical protein